MAAVYDRWHKSRPEPDEPRCREHGFVPSAIHGQGDRWQARWYDGGFQRKANFETRIDAERHVKRLGASWCIVPRCDRSAVTDGGPAGRPEIGEDGMTQPDDPYADALAAYLDPPGATVAERDTARLEALLKLRRIRRLEVAAACLVLAFVLGWAAWAVVYVPFPH